MFYGQIYQKMCNSNIIEATLEDGVFFFLSKLTNEIQKKEDVTVEWIFVETPYVEH